LLSLLGKDEDDAVYSIAPSTDEDVVSMTQVMDMMRTLQENIAASRSEQERMHEALVASQARNEELNKINEELRKALQEREERAVGDGYATPSPPRSFPMPFSQETWTWWSRQIRWR